MMTAVIWRCVFNLFWAESCRVYAFSGISLVTFFIQRLQMKWNEMKWNEWNEMKVQWFKVHSKAKSGLSLTHFIPVQPLSMVKTLDGPRVRVVSPVVKEKVYGGKDLLKSQVLSSEWNTERVREDASGKNTKHCSRTECQMQLCLISPLR